MTTTNDYSYYAGPADMLNPDDHLDMKPLPERPRRLYVDIGSNAALDERVLITVADGEQWSSVALDADEVRQLISHLIVYDEARHLNRRNEIPDAALVPNVLARAACSFIFAVLKLLSLSIFLQRAADRWGAGKKQREIAKETGVSVLPLDRYGFDRQPPWLPNMLRRRRLRENM